MTLSYRKILENAGTPPEYPKKEYIYNAYKDGMCKEFSTRDEAEKFSKLIEKKYLISIYMMLKKLLTKNFIL